MANLNRVLLIGNLTRDPEIRFTPKGAQVGEVGLAVNRKWKDANGESQEEVTFIDVVMWGKLAELASQYLTKGRSVFCEGRLQLDVWDDKQTGQKRSRLRVVAENMQFLGGQNTEGGPVANATAPPVRRPAAVTPERRQAAPASHAPSVPDDYDAFADDIP
jgi:single-strand DNA-binding protein